MSDWFLPDPTASQSIKSLFLSWIYWVAVLLPSHNSHLLSILDGRFDQGGFAASLVARYQYKCLCGQHESMHLLCIHFARLTRRLSKPWNQLFSLFRIVSPHWCASASQIARSSRHQTSPRFITQPAIDGILLRVESLVDLGGNKEHADGIKHHVGDTCKYSCQHGDSDTRMVDKPVFYHVRALQSIHEHRDTSGGSAYTHTSCFSYKMFSRVPSM